MKKKLTRAGRIKFFRKRQKIYRDDPVLFFREVLNFEPDDWQLDVANSITTHKRITVRSGQGVGKTALEAALLLWFLVCFPFPRIVATAPTKQQLHDVLWAEVAKWQAKSPLLSVILKWTKTYVYMVGMEKRWFAVARTAVKPENMQGFHEDNMLFIVDEASGVADPILEAIQGTLTGDNNILLLFGNPTKTSGVFYESHTKDRASYAAHVVNAENSKRTSKENIASLKRKYGEDSNVVRVRVHGEFPLQEDDVFIPLPLLEQSVKTEPREEATDSIHIGCDVARYGDDKTVIGYKVNERAYFDKRINGQDTMRTAADIVLLGERLIAKYKWGSKIPVKIDDGGVGGGVTDRLRQIKRSDDKRYWWLDILPVAFGQPIKHKHYYDSTTYMMSVVRDLLSTHNEDGIKKGVELIIPDDNDLIGQLSTRKYMVNDRNKIVVESKKSMKARGLASPDEADCLLLMCLPVKQKTR
jgi:hypothetical protein